MTAEPVVLVTGFGPFPGTPRNPTARTARAVDGALVLGHRVRGLVLPVSFQRGPDAAIEAARTLSARLVVGLGVANARTAVCVERVGVRVPAGSADVDGRTDSLLDGPDEVRATLDTACLATALGATLSDDAGRYVCNAWLYRVAHALEVPVGFVHVPAAGIEPRRVLEGVTALLQGMRDPA
ncbi:MAG: hypothetical protein R3F59_05945 [Myxococcota bacterium]